MDLTERTGGHRAEHLSVPCVFGCLRKGPVRRADAVGDVIRLCVVGELDGREWRSGGKNNRKILNRVLNVLTLSQFKRYENEMMEKERDKRAENGVKSFFAGYASAVSLIVPDNL